MRYFQRASVFLLLFIMLGLVSRSFQSKKVNCRKYVYAPICRGVAAKRALPRHSPGIPIKLDSKIIDPDAVVQWKDKDKGMNKKGLLQIILKSIDDSNGNTHNYLN